MAAIVADRHLLFGLLALQNGLIDQVQLVAAFQAWTRDKARSLADQLVTRGDLDAAACAGLEAIVALHVKKHGDVEHSLAAVPADRSTRARLAELGEPEIEASLARVIRRKDGLATEADDGNDPDRTAGLSLGASTSDGERFRLLRPHARGGLGEVFVALDAELHREVALKQILEKHADDPVSRQRFVAEAEITGGLEHPGVVPVYGVGTYAGGRPYYAMRFIRGDSLKEAITCFHADDMLKRDPGRLSLELRKLLRRILDVCNAIDYAHSRGVIHRDLKPANIILGRHGETLVVDWGLAKSVGRADSSVGEQTIAPSSSGSSETLPGSALGTPAYMSPEQASGDLDRLGAHSDVYALGATLYCLLTGKPPFDGDDVGGILRKVKLGEFPAPSAVNPALDAALEAICTKAMATKPADRYASCRALADDLERWAADEPVAAYPEPWTRTLVRWLTRHRTGVTGIAAAVLAGVVGLSAVLAVQAQANAQLSASLKRETKAKLDLAAANARLSDEQAEVEARNRELADEQAKVQTRFELAQKAIATFHTGVSEDFLLKNDKFKELRTKLLKEAAGFYADLEKLLAGQTDAKSRHALAAAYFQLGELTDAIGDKTEALPLHRKALALRRELAAVVGADVETRLLAIRSLEAVGWMLLREGPGSRAEALSAFQEQRDLAAALEAESPTDAVRVQMAFGHNRVGIVLDATGKAAEALDSYRKALAIYQKLPEGGLYPQVGVGPTLGLQLQAGVYMSLARVQHGTGQSAEGLESSRKAADIMQKLADAHPDNITVQSYLAGSHLSLGDLLSQTGKSAEAEAEYRKALPVAKKLVRDNPAVTRFRVGLAECHFGLGSVLSGLGKPVAAEAECREAVALFEKVADDNPGVPQFGIGLAAYRMSLGSLLEDAGKPAEAEAEYRKALALHQKLADDNPGVADFRNQLASSHLNIGVALSQAGKPAKAEAEYRIARALAQKLADENPAVNRFGGVLAVSHGLLGRLLVREKRFREAFTALEAGLAIYQKLVDADPKVTGYKARLGWSYACRGGARVRAGKPAEAAADLRRALELWAGVSPHLNPEMKYEKARALALLAGLGKEPSSGVNAAEAATFGDRSVASLRDAINGGWARRDELREPDFDGVRGRPDFQKLVAELEAGAGPKAKPKD
jgi:serine/threonine-protein kinase